MMYLLLAASCHRGPLALALIYLKKAYNWLHRVALRCMMTEELEVPADIQTSIEALYYQIWSVDGEVGGFCLLPLMSK